MFLQQATKSTFSGEKLVSTFMSRNKERSNGGPLEGAVV